MTGPVGSTEPRGSLQEVSFAEPSMGADSIRLGVTWLLGGGGAALQVVGNGANGVRGALVLLVGTALLTLAFLAVRTRLWAGMSAVLVVAVTIELWSIPYIGRAPGLIATASVLALAIGVGLIRPERRRSTWAVVPLIAVAGVSWAAGPSLVAPALIVSSLTLAIARFRRRSILEPVESGLDRVLAMLPRALAIPRRGLATTRRGIADPAVRLCDFARSHRWEVGVAVGVGAITFTTVRRLASDASWVVRGVNDYPEHHERVVALTWSPFFMSVPHPGFHVSVQVAENLLGAASAMTAVVVAATALYGVVLYRCGRHQWWGAGALRPWWSVGVVAVVLFIESPAVLVSAGTSWWQRATGFAERGRGAGFLNLHAWGSPTITMAAPFALMLVPVVIDLIRNRSMVARSGRAAALTVAGCLVLPAAVLALVPTAVLLVLLSDWPGGGVSRAVRLRRMAWMVVPAVAVCLWQVWFLATSQSPLEEATWRFNPFWLIDYFGMGRPVYWSLLLVPVVAAWSGGRRYFSDPAVRWVGASVAVAAFPMFLLQETGWKATHGGMAISFGVVFSLLVALSVRSIFVDFQALKDNRRMPRRRDVVVIAVLASGLLAGTLDLLASSGHFAEW